MTEMFLLDVLNKFNGKPANNEASEVSFTADLALTLFLFFVFFCFFF